MTRANDRMERMRRHLDYEHAASLARLAAAFRTIEDAAKGFLEPLPFETELRPELRMTDKELRRSVEEFTEDGPRHALRNEIRDLTDRYGQYVPQSSELHRETMLQAQRDLGPFGYVPSNLDV